MSTSRGTTTAVPADAADDAAALHGLLDRLIPKDDDVAGVGMAPALARLSGLSDGAKLRRVRELLAASSRLHALVVAAIADLEYHQVTTMHFNHGTATWLQHKTNAVSKYQADQLVREATALRRLPQIYAAVACAQVSPHQSAAMVGVLDDLADILTVEETTDAQHEMVGLAGRFDPAGLRQLSHHLLEVAAPERADQKLESGLKRQEGRARSKQYLSLTDDGCGSYILSGRIPCIDGANLHALLNRLAKDTTHTHHPDATATGTTGAGGDQDGHDGATVGGGGGTGGGDQVVGGTGVGGTGGGDQVVGGDRGGRQSRPLGARRADALIEVANAFDSLNLDQPGTGATTQVQLTLTPDTVGAYPHHIRWYPTNDTGSSSDTNDHSHTHSPSHTHSHGHGHGHGHCRHTTDSSSDSCSGTGSGNCTTTGNSDTDTDTTGGSGGCGGCGGARDSEGETAGAVEGRRSRRRGGRRLPDPLLEAGPHPFPDPTDDQNHPCGHQTTAPTPHAPAASTPAPSHHDHPATATGTTAAATPTRHKKADAPATPATPATPAPPGQEPPGQEPPEPAASGQAASGCAHCGHDGELVLGRGLLDGAAVISTSETHLMSCYAGTVLPTLTDHHGRLIAVGHPQRLFTGRLRQHLAARDHGCAFPDCTIPAALCDGHHILPWHRGGPTTLTNAVLLCRHHHRLIEPDPTTTPDQQWQVRLDHRGLPEFIPPTWIDTTATPRQHHRYQQ